MIVYDESWAAPVQNKDLVPLEWHNKILNLAATSKSYSVRLGKVRILFLHYLSMFLTVIFLIKQKISKIYQMIMFSVFFHFLPVGTFHVYFWTVWMSVDAFFFLYLILFTLDYKNPKSKITDTIWIGRALKRE